MTHPDMPRRTPHNPIRQRACAIALACALGAPLAASAQVAPLPFEVEGVVSDIQLLPDGDVELTIFGRVLRVPASAAIHTPTATLTPEQLASPSAFPGLSRPGFVGSTAIVIGEVSLAPDGTATPAIFDVAIEPAETVLIGLMTSNDGGMMAVQDVPLTESTDPRLPSLGYFNEFGFPVQPASIPVGTFTAVEGYYGDRDGIFRHFLLEAAGGQLVDPASPATSITRARCAPGGRLEVLGASYLPAAAVVEFRNAKTNYLFGAMNTTADLESPEFGTYRFRLDVSAGEVDTDGACPSQVLAINRSNQTEAVSDVDGVVAPPDTPPPPPENVAPVAVDDVAGVTVGLATEVHLTANDTDADGNLDGTTVQLFDLPPGLAVQNTLNGDVLVTAAAAGTYSFGYTVADTEGLVSNLATVTVTAEPVATDTVDVTRANFRTDRARWDIRGTTNQAGAQMTAVLLRTGATIAVVTSGVTGAWSIDVRNSPVRPVVGDVVRVSSSGGGSDDQIVTITR